MDIITHSIAGMAAGGAAAGRREALLAGFLGALALDLDSIVLVYPRIESLVARRGFLHSLAGVAIVSLALALFLPRFRKGSGKTVFIAAAAGGLAHLFLDLVTPWGVPLLWPLPGEYALGLTRGFDPWISLLVLAMLLVPWLGCSLRRRRSRPDRTSGGSFFSAAGRQQAVVLGLVVVAYLGLRFLFQGASLREFRRADVRDIESYALSALNPLRWRVVVRTDEGTDVYRVALPGVPEKKLSFHRAAGPCVEGSRRGGLAGAYLEQARFPHASIVEGGEGDTVTVVWRDLRDQLLHTYRSGEVRVTVDCTTGEILREKKRTWLDHFLDGTFSSGGTGR